MEPTLQDRAAELYAQNFLIMDIEKARGYLASHPLLEAFWMGIARSSVNTGTPS